MTRAFQSASMRIRSCDLLKKNLKNIHTNEKVVTSW